MVPHFSETPIYFHTGPPLKAPPYTAEICTNDTDAGISENRGPQNSTLNRRILIIRVQVLPGTQNFQKLPCRYMNPTRPKKLQYPLNQEYTSNHIRDPTII